MKGSEKARGFRPVQPTGEERYIALDIHKEYVLAGGQNAAQAWVMPPQRIGIEKFGE